VQDKGNASLQSSLDRLLLCNQIRELVDYPIPVKVSDISGRYRLFKGMVRLANSSSHLPGAKIGIWRRLLIDAPVVVSLRFLMYQRLFLRAVPNIIGVISSKRGSQQRSPSEITAPIVSTDHETPQVRRWLPYLRRILREVLGTIRAVNHMIVSHQRSSSEITGYVRSTDKEGPLIRVCMLLRVMRRYGVCIDFLTQRLNSGLPTEQTRQWLSFFLREVGDTQAAAMISPPIGRPEPTECTSNPNAGKQVYSTAPKSRRLKYGVVMLTMFDSDVFRSSLLSLLGSDFQGEIVVVEDGCQPERICESFCQLLPVKYVKNPSWTGPSGAMNLGIEQLGPETDIVIYAHSDVLWPQRWFDQLNGAWEKVYNFGKVGLINLGYMEFHPFADPAINELFIRGRYEDLIWLLRTMRDVQPGNLRVQDIQVKDMGRLFGLARDSWADRPAELRMMTGRFSVGASFLLQTWRDLGGFGQEMPYGMDMELQYCGFQNRKWTLWINNTPLIHLVSADTSKVSETRDGKTIYYKMNRETEERFSKKYGCDMDHFNFTYFAETHVIYHDEIIDAANEMRFSDIDFVFDDFFERLNRKKLSSCELVWCRIRATCPYV